MAEFLRRPAHRYQDPLTRVWVHCVERLGFRIGRSPDVFASSDGKGTIWIGEDAQLDPDDSLAQMIFHELCHALVQGEENFDRVDWGLGVSGGADPWREHACLRLQAWLADSVGLREFFAPTTDYRVSFWNDLPADPFHAGPEAGGRRERSCVAARLAVRRASRPIWAEALGAALAASATIAAATPRVLLDEEAKPSLWSVARQPPARHPAGHGAIAAYHAGKRCVDCAWLYPRRVGFQCRAVGVSAFPGEPPAPPPRRPPVLSGDEPACMRFEPAAELDCLSCGACCREAYHSVELSRREPLYRARPDLMADMGGHVKLTRAGERCAALEGGGTASEPYHCAVYDLRPRACREFERGGGHCLDARGRVGLSL